MLATGALIASLLAVGASPVGAEEEKADHKAATSACVGDALGDQMYSDVSDMHAFRDAINCIGYYGITNGTGDGSTFSPNDDVTRAEMAVFLARAAGAAGVDLGDAMDAGFDDIGDTWAEAQDAINQLADKGILPKGDSYRPNDAMTRAEMAIALIGLLNKASSNVKIEDDGSITLSVKADTPIDDHFADARALSPVAVDRAAAALFELGVTNGTGRAAVVNAKKTPLDTNFDPNGTVDRGQMAAFITRALAHTSARPEGLTAQALSDGKVVVSVRDENYAPVANTWVEVFYVSTSDEDDAFNANGTCSGLEASPNGNNNCEIDGGDLLTTGDGDAETQAITVPKGGVVTWAWSGDVGDEVDDDTTLYRLQIDEAKAPADSGTTAAISNDLAGVIGKIGSSVTVTLQLQKDGENVTGGAHNKDEPAEWVVYVHTFRYGRTPGTAAPTGGNIGPAVLTTTLQLKSDADGKATFVLASPPDQNPNTPGDAFRVEYDIRSRCDAVDTNDPADQIPDAFGNCKAPAPDVGTYPGTLPDATVTDGDAGTSNDHEGGVVFSDEKAVTTKISIDTSSYVQVASRAGRTALNRAKVTVSDQFGDPVRNVKVTLTSDKGDNPGAGTPIDGASSLILTGASRDEVKPTEYTTGSDGSYTFGYTWLGNSGDTEQLVARHDPTPDDTTNTDHVTTPTTGDDVVSVRWVEEAGPGTTAAALTGTVVDGDVEANEIVVTPTGGGAPVIIHYDDDDRLNTGDGAVDTASPASMAVFEKKLAGFLRPGGTNENVTWSNYMNRPRHTSVITLHGA